MSILCVGETLWDRFPDSTETLAGAPLNVATALQRLGDTAILISAVGRDDDGQRARQRLYSLGLDTAFIQTIEETSTGVAEIHLDRSGNPSYSIPRPAAFDFLGMNPEALHQLAQLNPEWLYFGTLAQTSPQNEKLLTDLVNSLPHISCFYDLNLRNKHWNFTLVERLSKLATIVKLNHKEAKTLFSQALSRNFSLEAFCKEWSLRYGLHAICITLGSDGCAVFSEGELHFYPGFPASVVDTVGAGDAFTAGFLHGLSHQWEMTRIARFSNALGSIVASRATAIPDWSMQDIDRLLL